MGAVLTNGDNLIMEDDVTKDWFLSFSFDLYQNWICQ